MSEWNRGSRVDPLDGLVDFFTEIVQTIGHGTVRLCVRDHDQAQNLNCESHVEPSGVFHMQSPCEHGVL